MAVPAHDRLDAARRLGRAAVAVCVLAVVFMVLGGALTLGAARDPRPALVEALSLSAPTLTPAGSPARTPASHPAISEGFLPGVDRLAPAPARLLGGGP